MKPKPPAAVRSESYSGSPTPIVLFGLRYVGMSHSAFFNIENKSHLLSSSIVKGHWSHEGPTRTKPSSSSWKQAACPIKLLAEEKECGAFRKSEIHCQKLRLKLCTVVKKPDVERPLVCSSRDVWGNYHQTETWWIPSLSGTALGGAPSPQQHAGGANRLLRPLTTDTRSLSGQM